MEKIVKQFILDNNMIKDGQTVLVALSGGMDSVALFNVLNNLKTELGFDIVCAHFDHGIRETAKRDSAFAQKISLDAGVRFFLGEGDVPRYSKEKNISIEMAARELRYKFLREIKEEVDADFIATAHHKTDQVETVLLNILRGSGILGLSGMKPKNGDIIRPFLCVTRLQIYDYVKKNRLSYVHDETNDDTAYKRNSIRHELVPMLKKYNPSVEDAIARMAEIATLDEEFINDYANKALKKMLSFENNEYILDIDKFKNEHLCIKRAVLRLMLIKLSSLKDMSLSRLTELLEFIENSNTGSIFLLNNRYKILHDYNKLYFVRNNEENEINQDHPIIIINPQKGIYKTTLGTFKIDIIEAKDAFIEKGEYFDLEKFLAFSPVFRYRKQGDIFKPLGGHEKKLKDYFIDKKMSQRERENTVLMASGKEILWVVGKNISEKLKVDEYTKKCLHIIFVEGKKLNA